MNNDDKHIKGTFSMINHAPPISRFNLFETSKHIVSRDIGLKFKRIEKVQRPECHVDNSIVYLCASHDFICNLFDTVLMNVKFYRVDTMVEKKNPGPKL